MFVPLPQYASCSDKDSRYCRNLYIDNEQDLKKEIDNLLAHNDEFIYRGVYNASYKMYSSSQRLWFLDDQRMLRLNCKDYYDTIECLIKLTANQQDVQQYIQQNNLPFNEFLILAMLQHFGSPSPMLDFSNSVLKGLFFAVDNMPAWTDNGTNNLDDYVSLYYIRRDIDWVKFTVQRVMENAAGDIDRLITQSRDEDPSLSIETKEVEDNIRNLRYHQFRPEFGNIFFLPVGGPAAGKVNIDIPALNFHCDYYIVNDRMISQDGLFIFNNTKDIPLVEVMNSVCKVQYFHCINIRKHLVPEIISSFLQPNGITHNSVYCIGHALSDQLQLVFNVI